MKTWIISLALFCCNLVYSQTTPCACCTEKHQQFDFWVGEWVVFDTTGTKVGENTIEKLENDCILSEYWRGASGSTGRSYNYYNALDDTWNQTWIDNNGGSLVLKGKARQKQDGSKKRIAAG